jgi:hypothetical protein
MTRALAFALGLGALTACGYTEEAYTADYRDAYCAKLDECGMLETMSFADVDACVTALTEVADASVAVCVDFDADKAQACVDETEAASCENWTAPSCLEVCAAG